MMRSLNDTSLLRKRDLASEADDSDQNIEKTVRVENDERPRRLADFGMKPSGGQKNQFLCWGSLIKHKKSIIQLTW